MKYKLCSLALKVGSGGEHDLKAEDIALIKHRSASGCAARRGPCLRSSEKAGQLEMPDDTSR